MSNGISFEAPAASPTALAQPDGAARRSVVPSVPNGGDSGATFSAIESQVVTSLFSDVAAKLDAIEQVLIATDDFDVAMDLWTEARLLDDATTRLSALAGSKADAILRRRP